MSEQEKSPNPRQHRRHKYVLDPKWQVRVSGGVAVLAVCSGLLLFGGTYYLATRLLRAEDSLESLSGGQTAFLALIANAIYFLILAGLLFFFALRITHAVAGPAMLLERAVEALRVGRYDSRLKLRSGDYLKSLATSLSRLTEDLQHQQVQREHALVELQLALDHGDYRKAHELVKEIRWPAAVPIQSPVERTAA